MTTKLLYNYKKGDADLSARIDALSEKLALTGNETLQDRIDDSVRTSVDTEKALRESAVSDIEERMEIMQMEIDGAITTYFLEGEPDLEEEPASIWDEDEYPTHLGDLYYDTATGYCYRWQNADGDYGWALVKDTDVTKALSDAAQAQALAASKAQTLVGAAVPTSDNAPASAWSTDTERATHEGDLYFDTTTGHIYRYTVDSGSFSWVLMRDKELDAKVNVAQGTAAAGHHLYVDAEGNISSALTNTLYLSNASGTRTFAITIGEDGALSVSEVVEDSGEE